MNTIDYDKNLLTYAENKYFQLEESDQYKVVEYERKYIPVVVRKNDGKFDIKEYHYDQPKGLKVKYEIENPNTAEDGEYKGFRVVFTAVKKGHKKAEEVAFTAIFKDKNL